MPNPPPNHVRRFRDRKHWSQEQLAERAAVSRAGISAIEVGRLVPSVAAALAIAKALDCRVEDLFTAGEAAPGALVWSAPPVEGRRYWRAQVGTRTVAFPTEAAGSEWAWHDGVYSNREFGAHETAAADDTLVIACCDPAVGLLAAEYAKATRFRLIAIRRSSQRALQLLREGLVHAAGVHLRGAKRNTNNLAAAAAVLQSRFSLVHVAAWQEGLALSGRLHATTSRGLLRERRVRWIGRETGSGARECLDEVFAGRPAPRLVARDHRGVAEAIAAGWADAGVCLRLPSVEAGLQFISVRQEDYDLCIPDQHADDPRVRALIQVLGSARFRRLLGELPGYDSRRTGQLRKG